MKLEANNSPILYILEAQYPLSFRKKDAQALSLTIRRHESTCLVAMKKVGISTFVRHFFYHPEVKAKYFGNDKGEYLFIYCDCNDLLEITPRAFWILMLTRLAETIAEAGISSRLKKEADKIFLKAILAKDPFLFYDSIRKIVETIVSQTNLYLIFFLVRFDRLTPVFDKQLINNLYALYDKVKFRLSYITTSVRPLSEIAPQTFSGNLPVFARSQFIKPATVFDMQSIEEYLNLTLNYLPGFDRQTKKDILEVGSGHITLTRIIVIVFSEWQKRSCDRSELIQVLLLDERIGMACEEIWENLTAREQDYLLEALKRKRWEEKSGVGYLFLTGILKQQGQRFSFFSPLFKAWIVRRMKLSQEKKSGIQDFTQKEKALFDLLVSKKTVLCSREEIIAGVWPEYLNSEDLAVSDWAIDRLVSRLRRKMKLVEEGRSFKIMTLRGRGYRLMQETQR